MSIRQTIRDMLARRLGVPEIPGALQLLAANGYAPGLVVDVGAYRGDFARLVLSIWPQAHVVCCESLPHQVAALRKLSNGDPRITVVSSLIGATEQADVVLHCTETASSVLEEYKPQNYPETHCPMTTLDRLFEKQYIGQHAGLVKIDVQGYEFEVIKGAERCLQSASALLIECNLLDIHKNVPLIHELTGWLAGKGWRIYDIAGLTRRPLDHALWQADLVFVPEKSPLRSDKRWAA